MDEIGYGIAGVAGIVLGFRNAMHRVQHPEEPHGRGKWRPKVVEEPLEPDEPISPAELKAMDRWFNRP